MGTHLREEKGGQAMKVQEAARAMRAMYPGRYVSAELAFRIYESGHKEVECRVYAEKRDGETEPPCAIAPTFREALASVDPGTTEREEDQGDGDWQDDDNGTAGRAATA